MADTVTKGMIADSGLHDYKIDLISIDYTASKLVIMLKDLNGGDAELVVCTFSELNITHNEPWGKGSYIVSSELTSEGGRETMLLELNSGDSITVKYA